MTDVQRLIQAVKQGDVHTVRQILDGDPWAASARTEQGDGPVLTAAYYGQQEILRLLVDRGSLDIFEAAAVGNAARLKDLIAEDPALVRARSFDGWTALHLAAFFGQLGAADILVRAGADLAAVSSNPTANQPLHAAMAGKEDERVIVLFLTAGADVRARGGGAITPLHLAAARGNRFLVELLLRSGADPSARTDDGQTAAALAVARGHAELADVLPSAS